jgi:hypothetical protein
LRDVFFREEVYGKKTKAENDEGQRPQPERYRKYKPQATEDRDEKYRYVKKNPALRNNGGNQEAYAGNSEEQRPQSRDMFPGCKVEVIEE